MSTIKNFLTRFKSVIYIISRLLQYVVAFTILVAIIITLMKIPGQFLMLTGEGSESLIHYLEYVINVIIAIEIIHVLCHQTMDSIIEVLSLAITREMILEKMATWQLLIGVGAIALLFVIRKFLYIPKLDKDADLGSGTDEGEESSEAE